jgi:GH15 family glucan-1,4-alpha-glucosidase
VWFTLSHGILNEIHYPRVDSASTRDLGLIVTDDASYFSEEKRDAIARLPARAGYSCVSGQKHRHRRTVPD